MDLNQPIIDFDGKPIPLSDEEGKAVGEMTFAKAIQRALLSHLQGDESLPGEKRFRLFHLAMKVDSVAKGSIGDKLRAEDIVEIKGRVGKAFSPLIVGRVWEMLEPEGTNATAARGTTASRRR